MTLADTMHGAVTAVATAAESNDPFAGSTSYLLTQGVLGVFAILSVLTFRVFWKREVARSDRERDDLTARAEKAEAEVARLNRDIQEKLVPALMESTAGRTNSLQLLGEFAAVLKERRGSG